ncbi:MAG: glutamate racemase [Helicobacteraceae bacterium]|nr:glutamate racemase [Helicobacteraceae bacterium]
MKVGVFDSGVGGLSVVKSLLDHKLFEELIYFGDTARVPYGVKDKNTITRYSLEALEFFKNFDIDLLIVACNSVSAYALDALKEHSSCDVVGVIEPGIIATTNALQNRDSNILILGTQATINSNSYVNLLEKNSYLNHSSIATSLFVPIVEEGLLSGEVLQSTLHHYFKDVTTPDAVILGCTHFPLISEQISNYFDNSATLIHSGEAIVEYLEANYSFCKKYDHTECKFFASENPEALRSRAREWLNIEV